MPVFLIMTKKTSYAAEISANDIREQSLAVLMIFALLVSAATFIQWFRRAYFNLHQRCENLMYS